MEVLAVSLVDSDTASVTRRNITPSYRLGAGALASSACSGLPSTYRLPPLFRQPSAMGSTWSSTSPDPQPDPEQPPDPPRQHRSRYGDVVPSECGKAQSDLYHDLYEEVYFIQHENGECIIAFQACYKDNPRREPEEWVAIADRVPRVYEYLDESAKARGINLHPRIVRYLGRLEVGYMLEKLIPGPLASCSLPPLTAFSSSTQKDKEAGREPLLLLYYRWALQSLSVLAFLHEQSVYVMDFSYATIWLRDDLSIALTGLLNATIPTDEWPYSPDGTRYETEIYYATNPETCGFPELGPKIDLADWATFVWRLMKNDFTEHDPATGVRRWDEPADPLDAHERPREGVDVREYHLERLKEGKLQLLEEERLGPVLVKAWKGEYENAREVIQDVRLLLEKMGVRMDGEDEVIPDNGERWEDIFTVVKTGEAAWGGEIQYK